MSGTATILRADSRALPLPDGSVDAVVCDPPYALPGGFMGKTWDRFDEPRAFQQWCEVWSREAYRVLKPGGFLLAFGGSRTWHRLVCAIEDSGFEIRDSMAWLYGSGFPKSLDVSKAIDRTRRRDYVAAAIRLGMDIPARNLDDWTKEDHAPGDRWWGEFRQHLAPEQWGAIEREVVGQGKSGAAAIAFARDDARRYDVTAPATDDARRWQGWGTALKPGFEPIVVARKPLAGTVAANVLAYGTGALNIDACRVAATARPLRVPHGEDTAGKATYGSNGPGGGSHAAGLTDTGRWPTNVVLSHAPLLDADGEVIGDACADGCMPGCPVAELDEQSGVLKSGANPARRGSDKFRDAYGEFKGQVECTPARGADSGGASRFFPVFRYQAKAPSRERPKVNGVVHNTVKPLGLMRWLVRLVTPARGRVLDMFAGSGTTLEAALLERFDVICAEETAEYLPLIEFRAERARAELAAVGAGEVVSDRPPRAARRRVSPGSGADALFDVPTGVGGVR